MPVSPVIKTVVVCGARQHGRFNHHGVLDGVAAKLGDHGLPGDQFTGRVAGVNRGDAETTDPLNERLAHVVSVDGAKLGLNGHGAFELILIVFVIEYAAEPDNTVGVNESRRNHFRT